jgi:hypothetical protein
MKPEETDMQTKQPAEAPSVDRPQQDRAKLSADDLARVQRYLNSPVHQIDRKPFRPWLMMLALLAVVGSLSLLSLLISSLVL